MFGGEVNETHNAQQRGERAEQHPADALDASIEQPGEQAPRRRKKRGEKEPVIVTDEQVAEALGAVLLLAGMYKANADRKWGDTFAPEWKREQLDKLEVSQDEALTVARPLARGMAEHGITLPWWAQCAAAALPIMQSRMALVNGIDAAIEKRKKLEEGKADAPA